MARAGDEASVAQPRAVGEVARHGEMGLEAAVVGGVALLDTELVGERTIDGHAVERLVQHRAREGGRVPAQRHGDHGAAAHLTAVRGIGHLLDPPGGRSRQDLGAGVGHSTGMALGGSSRNGDDER